MNGRKIKTALAVLEDHLSFPYPAMCWYFTDNPGEDALFFKRDTWVCVFMFLKRVAKSGRPLAFSKDRGESCIGAAEYLGYMPIKPGSGRFLVEDEHFKKSLELGEDYPPGSKKTNIPAKGIVSLHGTQGAGG